MTGEEAISHIRDILAENNSIKPSMVVFELEKEALRVAIKALEQEPCEDVISRQAVLEIFGYVIDYWKEHAIDVEPHEIKDALIEQYEFTAKQLSELPPVTPQLKMCFDGMTNGEVIQTLFPAPHIETKSHTVWVGHDGMSFKRDWWNTPYGG